MRYSCRHDNDIALRDLMRFAAFDGPTANFVRRDFFGIDRLAAGDKGSRTFDDIDHVGRAGVDLRLARTISPARIHLVAGVLG